MRSLKYFCIFSFTLLLLSCSIQKRNFRSGYHLEWKKHARSVKTKEALSKYDPLPVILPNVVFSQTNSTALVASVKSSVPNPVFTGTKTYLNNCDTLYLRKGGEIAGKVIEINPTEIKYKKCDNLDGPLIVIPKNDVRYIRYTNGITEEIPYEVVQVKNVSQKLDELRIQRDTENSLWYSLFGIPLCLLGGLGVVFLWFGARYGRRAVKAIGTDPKLRAMYGKKANIGYWTGLIGYLLVGGILVLLVTAMIGGGTGLLFLALYGLGIGLLFLLR